MTTLLEHFSRPTFQNLHDPARYEVQIQRMVNKMKSTRGVGALFETKQANIPLFSFGYDRERLSRLLAESVRKESYLLSPPEKCVIHIKEKKKDRIVYKFQPMDKIVIGVLAAFLTEALRPFLSDNVYSYRKGIGPKDEIIALSRFIKKQRRLKKNDSFFLFVTDIQSYSDEINVADRSYFWEILEHYFDELDLQPTEYHWYLIRESIRPIYLNHEGSYQCNNRGLPTGSPITPVLYNFYTSKADQYLERIPNLFYGRYGDDIIIAHHNEEYVLHAVRVLSEELRRLDLQMSPKKTNYFYFSPAGKPNEGAELWNGVNQVDLLGFSVNTEGGYAFSAKRQKKLIQKIRARVKNTVKILQFDSHENKGACLCRVINEFMLDLSSMNNIVISALRSCNDLKTLKRLDYQIALAVAEGVSGKNGVKAFRQFPYRKIRKEWGLKSLVQLKLDLLNKKFIFNL